MQLLSLLTALAAGVGCATPEESDVGASEGAQTTGCAESGCTAPAGKAIVTAASDARGMAASMPNVEASMYSCTINVQYVQVLGLKEAAQKKINAVLANVAKEDGFSIRTCEEPFDLNGSVQVRYNANDLPSVSTAIDSYYSGAAHPNGYTVFTSFDLVTGDRLQLKDIIRPEGKATLKAELIRAINRTRDDAESKQEALALLPRVARAPACSSISFVPHFVGSFVDV